MYSFKEMLNKVLYRMCGNLSMQVSRSMIFVDFWIIKHKHCRLQLSLKLSLTMVLRYRHGQEKHRFPTKLNSRCVVLSTRDLMYIN